MKWSAIAAPDLLDWHTVWSLAFDRAIRRKSGFVSTLKHYSPTLPTLTWTLLTPKSYKYQSSTGLSQGRPPRHLTVQPTTKPTKGFGLPLNCVRMATFCLVRALLQGKRRQCIGNVCQHVEDVALLSVKWLLRLPSSVRLLKYQRRDHGMEFTRVPPSISVAY